MMTTVNAESGAIFIRIGVFHFHCFTTKGGKPGQLREAGEVMNLRKESTTAAARAV